MKIVLNSLYKFSNHLVIVVSYLNLGNSFVLLIVDSLIIGYFKIDNKVPFFLVTKAKDLHSISYNN